MTWKQPVRAMAAALAAGLLVAAAGRTGAVEAPPPPPAPAPAPTPTPAPAPAPGHGLVEKTGVSLLLLDVEAVDRKGRPLLGLQVGDFAVKRDGRPWKVISVDDFCACNATTGAGTVVEESRADAVPTSAPAGAPDDRPLFVLYLDFGQLGPDGRHDAFEAARRWVREVKAEDEPVMIAGYVTSGSVVTLAGPTPDRRRLLEALDLADRDPLLVDTFAFNQKLRISTCEADLRIPQYPSTCPESNLLEYEHGQRSLEAFKIFLTRLGARPERKVVLYFHENGVLAAAPLYFQGTEPNHYHLLEEVGAEATAARAVVYPLLVGMDPSWERMRRQVLDFMSTLAEATGGAYNLGQPDLPRLVATAGRGCRCRYLLGLEPVEAFVHAVASVTITASGVRQRPLYRMRLLNDEDIRLRRASAVLDNPTTAQDIPVGAAIVPVRATARDWVVEAQVAVDDRSLALLSPGAGQAARWDFGARLVSVDSYGEWEMLATTVLPTAAAGAADTVLLHARQFSGLRPGRYRLTAFVRNRALDVIGGAESLIDLPDPKGGGVAGPVLLAERARRLRSTLPLTVDDAATAGGRGSGAPATGTPDAGAAPVPPLSITPGTTLLLESWLCAAPNGPPPIVEGILGQGDVPLVGLSERVEPPGASRSGTGAPGALDPCRPRVHELPTDALEPGPYSYTLRLRYADGTVASFAVPFVVIPPAGAAH